MRITRLVVFDAEMGLCAHAEAEAEFTMATRFSARAGSLGEFIKYRWPGCRMGRYLPWPPDAFGVAGAALRETGSYLSVLTSGVGLSADWRSDCVEAGREWRRRINQDKHWQPLAPLKSKVIPNFVKDCWRRILNESGVDLGNKLSRTLTLDLLAVLVAADTASAGLGLYTVGANGKNEDDDVFIKSADTINELKNDRRNFCLEVDTRKVCVMPKLHTPQRGLTIRSLSHHLALVETSELTVEWHSPLPTGETHDIINLLLLPWPEEVESDRFSIDLHRDRSAAPGHNRLRLFSYSSDTISDDEFRKKLTHAVRRAKLHARQIHAIVFPELALGESQYKVAEEVALQEKTILIAGVQIERDGVPINAAVSQPLGFSSFYEHGASDDPSVDPVVADILRIVQPKHHRWRLDRNQIIQYGLGGRLPASMDCWENISLEPRRLNIFSFADWMTMTVLVCEDLARQDPVAEALRSIAPGLVVALLMDGPQLVSRWSSRYATVLAEDPGCSVLTITSLGMSGRSAPSGIPTSESSASSRVVALWRDAIHGAEEIRIEPGALGCVLSLVCWAEEEITADGRGDGGFAYFPVYAGVHQVRDK